MTLTREHKARASIRLLQQQEAASPAAYAATQPSEQTGHPEHTTEVQGSVSAMQLSVFDTALKLASRSCAQHEEGPGSNTSIGSDQAVIHQAGSRLGSMPGTCLVAPEPERNSNMGTALTSMLRLSVSANHGRKSVTIASQPASGHASAASSRPGSPTSRGERAPALLFSATSVGGGAQAAGTDSSLMQRKSVTFGKSTSFGQQSKGPPPLAAHEDVARHVAASPSRRRTSRFSVNLQDLPPWLREGGPDGPSGLSDSPASPVGHRHSQGPGSPASAGGSLSTGQLLVEGPRQYRGALGARSAGANVSFGSGRLAVLDPSDGAAATQSHGLSAPHSPGDRDSPYSCASPLTQSQSGALPLPGASPARRGSGPLGASQSASQATVPRPPAAASPVGRPPLPEWLQQHPSLVSGTLSGHSSRRGSTSGGMLPTSGPLSSGAMQPSGHTHAAMFLGRNAGSSNGAADVFLAAGGEYSAPVSPLSPGLSQGPPPHPAPIPSSLPSLMHSISSIRSSPSRSRVMDLPATAHGAVLLPPASSTPGVLQTHASDNGGGALVQTSSGRWIPMGGSPSAHSSAPQGPRRQRSFSGTHHLVAGHTSEGLPTTSTSSGLNRLSLGVHLQGAGAPSPLEAASAAAGHPPTSTALH